MGKDELLLVDELLGLSLSRPYHCLLNTLISYMLFIIINNRNRYKSIYFCFSLSQGLVTFQ